MQEVSGVWLNAICQVEVGTPSKSPRRPMSVSFGPSAHFSLPLKGRASAHFSLPFKGRAGVGMGVNSAAFDSFPLLTSPLKEEQLGKALMPRGAGEALDVGR